MIRALIIVTGALVILSGGLLLVTAGYLLTRGDAPGWVYMAAGAFTGIAGGFVLAEGFEDDRR